MRNNFYLLVCIIISVLLSTYAWNLININFGNTEIIGDYFINKHHALNDPLRYIFFTLIPIIAFLLFSIFYRNEKFNIQRIKFENYDKTKDFNTLFFLNIIILLLIFIQFFSLSFPLSQIDIYHEGQKLSAPYKSVIDGKLWSGSLVTTGIINENLGIKFIWEMFDHQSIGLMRFLHLFYILIFKISLIVLCYLITKNVSISSNGKLIFFLIISLISISLIDYDLNSGNLFSYRDIPIIFSLILFFKYLENFKHSYLSLMLIGFLSVVTFFWSIDRALVLNLLLISMCIFILINKEFKSLLIIIFSIIFSWFLFYLYLGDEFKLFYENSFSVLKNQNYIHGIIHPQPFSEMPNSTRATKSLLLITLSLIISLSFIFKKREKYNNNFKIIIILLSFLSFFTYIYALGRSDGGHIKQTTGPLILFFSVIIFFTLISYFKNFLQKKFLISKISTFLILILFITFFISLNINYKNIVNYSKRFNEYIYLEDRNFLSKDQNYLVKNLKPSLEKFDCIQLFTYDAALPYLLKKPNCTKYYFIYSLGSIEDQKSLIKEMKDVKFVIYSGQTDNWGFSPQKKLTIVNKYINSEFLKNDKILDWELRYK